MIQAALCQSRAGSSIQIGTEHPFIRTAHTLTIAALLQRQQV